LFSRSLICFFLFLCFSQLDEIIRDTTPPADGEEHVAALTAGERPLWAEARETYFRTGVNRISLEAIEKAAFVLILDDVDYEIGTVNILKQNLLNLVFLFCSGQWIF
jgi:hypothetical protein